MEWRHNVTDADSLVALYTRLGEMSHPFHVAVSHGTAGKRSISQNGLFHKWMGQIAKATHDDPASVKVNCHIEWGIPQFRADDPEYSDFIEHALGGLIRPEVEHRIRSGYIPCTRIMPKATLSRYMDSVWRHYAPHLRLTDPQELKWRDALS